MPISPVTRRWLRRLPLAIIALGAVLGIVFLRDHFGFQMLAQNRDALLQFRDAHYLLASLVFVAAYVTIVGFGLPGALLITMTSGFLFGLFPGVLYNIIGATTGAVLVFQATRMGIGGDAHARITSQDGTLARVQRAFAQNEVAALLMMRLTPGMPFFLVNLVPAFLGTSLRRFTWTTMLGIIPGDIAYTSVGVGLGHIFDQGKTPDLGMLISPPILMALFALAALSLLPVVIKLFQRKGG